MRTSRPRISPHVRFEAGIHREKHQAIGREIVVAITGGKLDLGPWEQIFHGEFDGRWR